MIDSPPTDRIAQIASEIEHSAPAARSFVSLALVATLVLSAAAVPATAQADEEPFQLETESVSSTAEVTIAGTTTLDPGTELQIRVQSAGETDPQFLKTQAATVGEDGSWNATFDLSAVETHDSITITVAGPDGNQTADFDVPIRNDQSTPTESRSDTSTPGFGVVVAVAGVLGSAAVLRRRRGR